MGITLDLVAAVIKTSFVVVFLSLWFGLIYFYFLKPYVLPVIIALIKRKPVKEYKQEQKNISKVEGYFLWVEGARNIGWKRKRIIQELQEKKWRQSEIDIMVNIYNQLKKEDEDAKEEYEKAKRRDSGESGTTNSRQK